MIYAWVMTITAVTPLTCNNDVIPIGCSKLVGVATTNSCGVHVTVIHFAVDKNIKINIDIQL